MNATVTSATPSTNLPAKSGPGSNFTIFSSPVVQKEEGDKASIKKLLNHEQSIESIGKSHRLVNRLRSLSQHRLSVFANREFHNSLAGISQMAMLILV